MWSTGNAGRGKKGVSNSIHQISQHSHSNRLLREEYVRTKPQMFALSNLVEVQLSFMIVRVARQEYAFIPRLHAICSVSRMVETVSGLGWEALQMSSCTDKDIGL